MTTEGATDVPVAVPQETAASTRYQSGPLLDAASTEDLTQDAPDSRGSAPSSSIESVMLLLTQLIQSMPANIAAAVKVERTGEPKER